MPNLCLKLPMDMNTKKRRAENAHATGLNFSMFIMGARNAETESVIPEKSSESEDSQNDAKTERKEK